MKLECIITCVNYSDLLAHTLPINKQYFNKTVVVTTVEDLDTIRLCEIHDVECIKTSFGTVLNKGQAINDALSILDKDGWVLQLDADVWLHPQAMKNLFNLKLNPQCLYGCDRIMIESFKDFMNFLNLPDIYENDWLMNLSKFKIGSRITHYWTGEQWQVLGFFQLWNPKGSNQFNYPEYEDASRSDILFSEKFHRSRRILLPEVIAIHLEEGESQTGKNWRGRKSSFFWNKIN